MSSTIELINEMNDMRQQMKSLLHSHKKISKALLRKVNDQSTKIARLEREKMFTNTSFRRLYSDFSEYRTQTDLHIDQLTKDLDDQKIIARNLSYVLYGNPNSNFGSGDVGSEDVGSEHIGSEDVGSGDVGSEHVGSEDIGSGDIGSGDVGSGDVGSEHVGSGDIYHLNLDFQPENPYIVVENLMNDYWSIINNMRNLNNIVQNNENLDFHVASPSDLQFAFQESPTPQGEPSGQQRFIVPEGVEIPNEFLCPITLEIMQDPVIASDGNTYESSAILQHISMNSEYPRSPLTRDILQSNILIPNNNLVKMIEDFCMSHVISRQK